MNIGSDVSHDGYGSFRKETQEKYQPLLVYLKQMDLVHLCNTSWIFSVMSTARNNVNDRLEYRENMKINMSLNGLILHKQLFFPSEILLM